VVLEVRLRVPRHGARATFDQALKTPRYALSKALNLSGGIRIGKL
jgi:hypothetical protein